jgi:hypothetical protein
LFEERRVKRRTLSGQIHFADNCRSCDIAYGRHTAREIVLALIVDDGVRDRGHRKNIFNPTYNVAGAAYGSHARFGSVCSIDFASGYAENRLVRAGSDAQNSF